MATRGSSPTTICFICIAALVLAMALIGAQASPLSSNSLDSHTSSINNFDYGDLISNMLDDAGNRLKKSKLHGRQIKTTPRFGRRSDPLMGYGPYELQQIYDANDYDANREQEQRLQRQLVAALVDN